MSTITFYHSNDEMTFYIVYLDFTAYNKWREFCGLKKAKDFDDMVDIASKNHRYFKDVYE